MSFFRHSTVDDITLFLNIRDPTTGVGVTGLSPEVSIRRVRASKGGSVLDGYYWNGVSFGNTPVWLTLAEFDATEQPGLYIYLFEQSLVGADVIYLVYFRHTATPEGFAVEEHIVSDEVYVPSTIPAVPVAPGDTVMGRLAAMEDPDGAVAQANTDAVLDESIGPHALISGSVAEAILNGAVCAGGTGANIVTVTIEDDVGDLIQGVQLDLYRSGNFLLRAFTDAVGRVVLALDDSTYEVRLFANGYAFTVPEILVVSGTTAETYQGTGQITITPPSAPNLCVIYGTLRDAAGNPHDGICIEVYGVTPQVVSGVQLTERIASIWTDAHGYFELELEREARVQITAIEAAISAIKDVPDAESQDLATWADAVL